MSKRKGLSVEDKRNVLMKIYHDKKEPLNLKEIEHFGSKGGVVQQTIKDINQSLCDDGIVMSDKIGAANFFWSFPSKMIHDKVQQKLSLECEMLTLNASIQEYELKKDSVLSSRKGEGRSLKLSKLEQLKLEESNIDLELKNLKMNDPEQIATIGKQSENLVSIGNRWTDNIWAVKKYLTKKKGMSGKEVDKFLGIDSTFDYLDN